MLCKKTSGVFLRFFGGAVIERKNILKQSGGEFPGFAPDNSLMHDYFRSGRLQDMAGKDKKYSLAGKSY